MKRCNKWCEKEWKKNKVNVFLVLGEDECIWPHAQWDLKPIFFLKKS